MVRDNHNLVIGTFEVTPPSLEAIDYGEQLLVGCAVVDLCCSKFA